MNSPLECLNVDGRVSKFAAIVGTSETNIAAWRRRGKLPKNGTYADWIIAYCDHLRERAQLNGPSANLAAKGDKAGTDDLDLAAERARLAKMQADKIEMENAVRRGELVEVDILRTVLADVAGQLSSALESIPVKLRREAPHLTATDLDVVKREIAKARNLMSEIKYVDNQ